MSQSEESLFSQLSAHDAPDMSIELGSRFSLEIRQFPRLDQMRVKLFACQDRQWKDLGTGHVMCHNELNESFIVFRLRDGDANHFESLIRKECVYNVQQGTLICWMEYGTEVALSFSTPNGCAEFYDMLHRSLGGNPASGNEYTDSSMSDLDSDEMPPLEMCRLFEIEQYVKDHMGTPALRKKLAQQFNYEEFMPTLSELFHLLESIEDETHLTKLGTIVKALLSMDHMELLKRVLDDQYLKDLLGMLEYDVSAPKKMKHRSFVYEQSRFLEIVPIQDDDCVTKIHRLYRLQYVLEQCMPQPSIFDRPLTVSLSLYIENLRSEIFGSLLDSTFVVNLFAEIRSGATNAKRLRSLLHLFVDFVDLGTHVSGPAKGAYFADPVANDMLSLLSPCISCPDPIVRLKYIEILDRLVTMNAHEVLGFLHAQASESPRADALVTKLLLMIFEDPDPELPTANLVADLMQNVLSPEQPCAPERGHFLNYFYRISMRDFVVAFVKTLQGGKLLRDDYHTANRTYCAINFINSCLLVDRARFHRLIEDFDVITTALVVLQSRHHFLALGGVRMLRLAVGFQDPPYDDYIVNNDSFAPLIDCAKKYLLRENMLKSAIMDLFNSVAITNHMPLIKYAVEEHGEELKELMPRIYDDLRSQHENRHVPQALVTKRKAMKKLAIGSIPTPEMKTEKIEEEDGENTDPAEASVQKPKESGVQVKRSFPDEAEDGKSKAKEKKIVTKEEKIITKEEKTVTKEEKTVTKEEKTVKQEAEAVDQKPLVDYDSSDSDDSGEDKGGEKTPEKQAPRRSPRTPRPVRAPKRPPIVWDENDKPSTAPEAKKSS